MFVAFFGKLAYARPMLEKRVVSLFRNGRNQSVRIPREFELPGSRACLYQDGGRLILEPEQPTGLLAYLATLEPLDDDFPDVDETLPPAGAIVF